MGIHCMQAAEGVLVNPDLVLLVSITLMQRALQEREVVRNSG